MKRILLFLLPLFILGCSGEDHGGNVVVAFTGFSLTGPTADPGTPVTDEAGLAHLDRFPAFLVVRVTAADLEAPIVATWPDVVPEAFDETDDVELELEVPPGEARQVDVSLMWADEADVVDTFVASTTAPFTVVSNQTTDVPIDFPNALAHGTVRATWAAGHDVASVAWVDSFLGAVMPPTLAVDGVATTELSEGRTYWPIVLFADGTEGPDLSTQTVTLMAGQSLDVTLQLTN